MTYIFTFIHYIFFFILTDLEIDACLCYRKHPPDIFQSYIYFAQHIYVEYPQIAISDVITIAIYLKKSQAEWLRDHSNSLRRVQTQLPTHIPLTVEYVICPHTWRDYKTYS